ncbi:D-alanyl-D-alanine carboxypeptidase / D-alanyl-D-alanine-endopeptidase (penicillin-binding protein 4) [Micrococcales bacterium KH10]|nr:D-alanyl-D-alanine carboxypeptidase / D-alanyl-D-alanine-endopeptidase (penicillin-binding protein 4) [Micrococcales bacterium KH10]
MGGGLIAYVVTLALVASGGAVAHANEPIWTIDDARQLVRTAQSDTQNDGELQASAQLRVDSEYKIATRIQAKVSTARLGAASSLQVIDVASGDVIYQRKPAMARTVASNTKLLTAVAALHSLSPKQRFETTITRRPGKATVHFVSGGDPLLTRGKLRKLARQTADDIKRDNPGRKKITVKLDDSLFKGARKHKSWRQGGYNLGTIQPVRATARAKIRVKDSSMSAARAFAVYLDSYLGKSMSVRYAGRAQAPRRAVTVATVRSKRVKKLVRLVLLNSDNQVAEVLLRHIALAEGRKPTFKGGARATLQVLRRLGIDTTEVTMIDGSGLSPLNRMTPRFLTSVLRLAADPAHKELRSILYQGSALPVAGRTGTLRASYGRFTSAEARCGAGHILAKTGNLDYEIALSGYAVGSDGRLKAFSILVNSVRGSAKVTARQTMDEVAAAISGACA